MALSDTAAPSAMTMRPHHLLCLFCRQGGGRPPDCEAAQLDQMLARIAADRKRSVHDQVHCPSPG